MIADNEAGLLFKNKRDRKVINVDPRAKPGDNSTRTELETSEYLQVSAMHKRNMVASVYLFYPARRSLPIICNLQVVVYDHVTRRRS